MVSDYGVVIFPGINLQDGTPINLGSTNVNFQAERVSCLQNFFFDDVCKVILPFLHIHCPCIPVLWTIITFPKNVDHG